MTARPQVSVFNNQNPSEIVGNVALPGVFKAPIRLDIVHFVYSNLSKNSRQAHGVKPEAGMQHSAESWGTGRAVARVPRVSGSGTHRAGQAAFANMVRKGRMFAPLKTWRRWHRKVNVKQRRHAVASALAASAITPLVQSRGHRVDNISELPLILDDKIESIEKTKDAVALLKKIGAYQDVQKVIDTKVRRSGVGKLRNKKYKLRKGPLIIYGNENVTLLRAVRNIPGVETLNVHRLNLKHLAPGGQLGRFIIWTKTAFQALDKIFGSYRKRGEEKGDYQIQRPLMHNADLARLINSNEIQSVVRNTKVSRPLHELQKKNPLKNDKAMQRLNPYHRVLTEQSRKLNEENRKKREQAISEKRGITKRLSADQKKERKVRGKASKQWIKTVLNQLDESAVRDKETAVNLSTI